MGKLVALIRLAHHRIFAPIVPKTMSPIEQQVRDEAAHALQEHRDLMRIAYLRIEREVRE